MLLSHGLLTVTLRREIPEQAKPRRIESGNGSGEAAPLQLEADKQAA